MCFSVVKKTNKMDKEKSVIGNNIICQAESVTHGERRRRINNSVLSGNMCFSVTMAFLIHNLSHQALWELCLSFLQMAEDEINHDLLLPFSLQCFPCAYPESTSAKRKDKHTLPKTKAMADIWQVIHQPHKHFKIYCLLSEHLL